MVVIDPNNIPVAQVVQENMNRNTESEDTSTPSVNKKKEDDDDDPLSCYGLVLCLMCGMCILTKDAFDEGACF